MAVCLMTGHQEAEVNRFFTYALAAMDRKFWTLELATAEAETAQLFWETLQARSPGIFARFHDDEDSSFLPSMVTMSWIFDLFSHLVRGDALLELWSHIVATKDTRNAIMGFCVNMIIAGKSQHAGLPIFEAIQIIQDLPRHLETPADVQRVFLWEEGDETEAETAAVKAAVVKAPMERKVPRVARPRIDRPPRHGPWKLLAALVALPWAARATRAGCPHLAKAQKPKVPMSRIQIPKIQMPKMQPMPSPRRARPHGRRNQVPLTLHQKD